MPSQEAHPLKTTTAQATALLYIPDITDCQAVRVTLCLVEAGAREIVPDLLATPPLGQEFLRGLQTARNYLRSLQDPTNRPLWSQNADLKLKIEAPGDGGPLPRVDGRSATALVAALGESLLRGSEVADRTCCVSADLFEEPGEGYRLRHVEHVPEKTRTACETRLPRLVVSSDDLSAAKEAVDDYQRVQENHLLQHGHQAPLAGLHVVAADTVAEVVRLLSEDTVVLLRYLDRIARRMVDDISLIDHSWREQFFRDLYQNQYVTYEETTEDIDDEGRRRKKKTQVRKKWSEWAADKHRVSLLAEAGHGKSTLLRWITWDTARKSAEQLASNQAGVKEVTVPFFFRCEDLAPTDRGGPYPLEDSVVKCLRTSYGIGTREGKLLKKLLRTDKALIVLDALDEAPNQHDLLRSIDTFAANHPQPRIYLSCRTRHFPNFNWPTGEASGVTIELSPFSPEDLSDFIQRWGRLTGEPQRAEQFARQAAQNSTLASVVKIPLFAVLSCLTYLSDGSEVSLPVRRVELLERCWESFDERWEREKREESSFKLGITARQKALVHVAWHYARQGNFGSFPKRELREVLTNAPGPAGALQLAGALQPEEVLHELPLLVPDGDPHASNYRFQVRQLQEYFAACALARQEDPFGTIKPVLHHPEWRETILLTAGVLGQDQAVQYIKAILEAGSRDEILLGRDLFLAAHCCGEVPPDYLESTEGKPLLDRLLKALEAMAVFHVQSEDGQLRRVKSLRTPSADEGPVAAEGQEGSLSALSEEERGTWAAIGMSEVSGWEVESALEAMSEVAQPVGWSIVNNWDEELWYGERPSELLTALRFWEMRTPEELLERVVLPNADPDVFLYPDGGRGCDRLTEAALTELARRGPAGEAQLKQALSPKQDVRVRLATVGVLRQLAGTSETAGEVLPLLPLLSETLRSDPDAHVRTRAVETLGKLVDHDETADQILPPLTETLRSDPDAHVRIRAVETLGKLAPNDEMADQMLPLLAETLRSDPDAHVRLRAVEAFDDSVLFLEWGDEILSMLSETLRSDADPGVRSIAFHTLIGHAVSGPWVILPTLAQTLLLTTGPDECRACIDIPGRFVLEETDDEMSAEYEYVLEETNEGWSAEYVIGERADQILPVLMEVLRADPDGEVRSRVFDVVVGLAITNEETDDVLPELLQELGASPRVPLNCGALERAVDILLLHLGVMYSDADEEVRSWALERPGYLGPYDRLALPLLLKAATDTDEDARCRREAVGTIAKLGFAVEAQETLLRLLQDEDRDVRSAAADALTTMYARWQTLPDRLRTALYGPDTRIRAHAVEALAGLNPPTDLVLPEITRALADEATPVRRAALEALSALGQEPRRQALPHIRNLLWVELPTWLRDGPLPAEGIGHALDCAELRLEAAATLLSLTPPNLEVSLEALLSVWEVYWQLAGEKPALTSSVHKLDRQLDSLPSSGIEYEPYEGDEYDSDEHVAFMNVMLSADAWEEEHRDEVNLNTLAGRACEIVWARLRLPDPAKITADQVSSLLAELDSPDLGLRWRARTVLEAMKAFPEPLHTQIGEALERDRVRVEEARNALFRDPRVEKRELLAVPCEERTVDWMHRIDMLVYSLLNMGPSAETRTAALPEEA